jgi:hypothetical protein
MGMTHPNNIVLLYRTLSIFSVLLVWFSSVTSVTIYAETSSPQITSQCALPNTPTPQYQQPYIQPFYIISSNFSAGAFANCTWNDTNHLTVQVAPEDPKINPSPWYAFDITPLDTVKSNRPPLTITLDYGDFKHRYAPKLFNQKGWQHIPVPTDPQQRRANAQDNTTYTFDVVVNSPKIRIAAQPIIDAQGYERWTTLLSKQLPSLHVDTIGRSVEQRDIKMLSHITDPVNPFIILIGRQHPPELTGAMAMLSFVPELLADSDLAHAFRTHFNLLIFPLVNPDGVHHGHWRHNLQSTDLNRDWGPFKQPETQVVIAQIDTLTTNSSVWTMLDFHSTYRDILYTHNDDATHILPTLARDWLARINADGPITFERKSSHSPNKATTKTYFHTRYNSPAITYELNDTSSPEDIAVSSSRSAQHFMQLLLEYKRQGDQ